MSEILAQLEKLGGEGELQALFVGTSYQSPSGRLYEKDGTTSEMRRNYSNSVSCNSFSVTFTGSYYFQISRLATDATKTYVLSIRQGQSDYAFTELTNDNPTFTQTLDGSITVVALK